MQYLNLAPGSMIVFDKAYNYYLQYAKCTQTNEESKQKPIGRTAIIVLRNGEGIFLENEFLFS